MNAREDEAPRSGAGAGAAERPFDQTNGVLDEDSAPGEDPSRSAQQANGAALGSTGFAGWGR